jgi:hypothetical protein
VPEQTATEAISVRTGEAHHHATHHGRTSSWVAVAIIVVGFVVGGVAMFFSPVLWVMFWVGAGIVVVGGIMALTDPVICQKCQTPRLRSGHESGSAQP